MNEVGILSLGLRLNKWGDIYHRHISWTQDQQTNYSLPPFHKNLVFIILMVFKDWKNTDFHNIVHFYHSSPEQTRQKAGVTFCKLQLLFISDICLSF